MIQTSNSNWQKPYSDQKELFIFLTKTLQIELVFGCMIVFKFVVV